MPADPNEMGVVFTVKELFLDLKRDLERIENKVEHVASQADLDALKGRVSTLETDKVSAAAVEQYKRWQVVVGGLASAGLLVEAVRASGLLK